MFATLLFRRTRLQMALIGFALGLFGFVGAMVLLFWWASSLATRK